MKKEKYYVGLDIGTDSVGYAVTNEQYKLCKHNGEPMWGVTLFDPAELAVERRSFRIARRRLDRRQHRVKLLMDLFAYEIAKIDESFFKRIKESYLYPESVDQKIRLFDSYDKQKEYTKRYPTIHHLITELMDSTEPHDVRLVYLACAWLVAHRGHFLSEVDKNTVEDVISFNSVWERLNNHITRDEHLLPWKCDIDIKNVADALKKKLGVTKKSKLLAQALFDDGKPPKAVTDAYEYNYELTIKLLCGGDKVSLQKLFDKDNYADLEEKSISLNMDDEKFAAVLQSIDDSDAEFISALKAVYDWSVLADILKGKISISEAKKEVYEQHAKDLKHLKFFVKKYTPQKYNDIFRSEKIKNNYVSYIGKNKTSNKELNIKKSTVREDFCKYILSVVKNVKPQNCDQTKYDKMIASLEANDFMPKQVDGDNRVIPYQLYWYELNKILENAKSYIPFLDETDEDGITGAEKILSVFEFRVPYFVGPLKENPDGDRKLNYWMVRKSKGNIYPWNFNDKVDLEQSENEFIKRMTNSCTYLPGEDVLPKNSLVYSAFEVLNEINNIRIDDKAIPVSVKQSIFNNVFMARDKVTIKHIKGHLESIGLVEKDKYVLSGLDETIKSSLKPFKVFSNLVCNGRLTYSDAEKIINRATYSEDKSRFKNWLRREYPHLPEGEITYISGKKFKEFGRLSRKFLCEIEGAVNEDTGEYMTIIRTMWETNLNLMQIIHSDKFDFATKIEAHAKEYYGCEKKSIAERLDDMYVSNTVKRQIIRAFDILKDIQKLQGNDPETVFIEMARGANEDQKGTRTKTRLAQICELYEKIDTEDVRNLNKLLYEWGDTAHNKLQSDKIFLYFMQLGKCLYTGRPIELHSVLAGDGTYNIEHIYPRSFVKDDSIINNKILVESKANGDKSDTYPILPHIQNDMRGYWTQLNKLGLISDEKFKRLTRKTPFTDDEKFEFINRQLVETRQSTKVVATLLKELYPNTEVVYVKAGLVSDFRQQFDLPKSRTVNDLHHAKDAYLNIVVGNVWHHKFSKQYYKNNADNNVKAEVIFTHRLVYGNKVIWNGAADKDRVVEIARKNTAHVTKYAFCRKGGFFDQMPVSAAEGLVPRKKGMPTEIYGGYNKTTASFFVLVKYTLDQKQDVMVMPVELLYSKKFLNDQAFAEEYAKRNISTILNKDVISVEFPFKNRILKVNTMLSLDGLRVCITGKASGGKTIGASVMSVFKTSIENEAYIKKLESFEKKKQKNPNIVWSEQYDGISAYKNIALYDCYIEKLQKAPYKHRPANPVDTLVKGKTRFEKLSPPEQAKILLQIQGLFGRAIRADLTSIGGVASAGVVTLSSSISNWGKNYTDVRIIDQSASGLFEKASGNLLDLL